MSARFDLAERNHGIDLLRGIAVLLVILRHIDIRIPATRTDLALVLPRRVLWTLFTNGHEAVFVFFTISGFLIAGNLLTRHGSLGGVDVPRFYIRRAARILPCLGALVAVLSLLATLGLSDYRIDHPGLSLAGAVMAAFGLCMNVYLAWVGQLPAGWDVLWSLSIEEVFYLGFPLLCLIARLRPRWVWAALVLFGLALPWWVPDPQINRNWSHKAYLPGMAAIALGVVAAGLRHRIGTGHVRWARIATAAGGLMVAAVLVYEDRLGLGAGGAMLFLSLGTATLLVGLSLRPMWAALVRATAWLQGMGRRSYEVYLTHMFVVLAGIALFRASGAAPATGGWVSVPLVIGAAWLGAMVGRWFSDPADRWLRARLPRRPALSSAVVQPS